MSQRPAIQAWLPEVESAAEAARNALLPDLSPDLQARFHRDGDRVAFETAYFERRRQLGVLALAQLLLPAHRDRATGLWTRWEAVLAEPSWALPAHVRDPSGRDPTVIDLFAAETTNLMAELLDLFAAVAPADLVAATRRRVREMIDLYLATEGGPERGWFRCGNNWNAVCNQGVAGAALAGAEPDVLAHVLARVARNLPAFLAGFSADGGCSEGPGYWGYGFGRFAWLNRQLETRTGGGLSLFGDLERIRRIARYGPAMVLPNERLINFSDAPTHGNLDPALLAYLADRLADPVLSAQAAATFRLIGTPAQGDRPRSRFDYGRPGHFGPDLYGIRADVFHLVRYALHCPAELPVADTRVIGSTWLPDLAVWVARGRDERGVEWAVAAKGGHNAEHHNHNDVGSLIVHHGGENPLAEIGLPEYTREFFQAQTRYGFLAARSLGHSLPLLNGYEQAAGREHAGVVLRAEFKGHGGGVFEVELAACYPPAAQVRSCRRRIVVQATPFTVVLQDTIEFAAALPAESALITLGQAFVENDGSVRIENGSHRARLFPGPDCRVDRIEEHGYVSRFGRPATAQRIVLLAVAGPAPQVRLAAELRCEASSVNRPD